MLSYFDITWIPRAFDAIRNAVSSFRRETHDNAINLASRPVGSVQQVGELCRDYLNDWGTSITQLDFHAQRQAGMDVGYNPFNHNALRSSVGRRLFSAFVFGILRMRIGLMEIRYAPSDIRLPDPIQWPDSTKRQVASWVAHARTRFRELFASNTPPAHFSITPDFHLLEASEDSSNPSVTLFRLASRVDHASDQMRFLSNILYVAWALRSLMEQGDSFLVSKNILIKRLSNLFIRITQ